MAHWDVTEVLLAELLGGEVGEPCDAVCGGLVEPVEEVDVAHVVDEDSEALVLLHGGVPLSVGDLELVPLALELACGQRDKKEYRDHSFVLNVQGGRRGGISGSRAREHRLRTKSGGLWGRTFPEHRLWPNRATFRFEFPGTGTREREREAPLTGQARTLPWAF